jgi:voltage-gated potassium channel
MEDGNPPPNAPGDPAPTRAGAETASFVLRDHEAIAEDPTGRLGAYLARTETPLDVLALVTLWIVVVPVADFGNRHGLRGFGLTFRLVLSAIYGVDMAIRTVLARRHWHYLRSHPLGLLAVVFPPVRVLFSLRLIRVLFRRGNLDRFLLAALFLMLNGSLIVWLFERDAAGSNIHTLGESIWWSIVTVTTVGYGDYYPVTTAGQVVATFIMAIGIITVAVITAQVASSFVDQSAKRDAAAAAAAISGTDETTELVGLDAAASEEDPVIAPPGDRAPAAVTLDELDARLSRIEQLLVSLQPPPAGDGAPGTSG